MKQKFLLLIFFVTAYVFFKVWNDKTFQSTDLASSSCVSEKELKKLIKNFSLQISFENFSCNPNDTRTFLIDTLKSTNEFNFTPPEGWGPEAREIFSDIGGYLKKHLKAVRLIENKNTSMMVGTNPAEGLMELTHRLRELTRVEAVSMLVHEVRHIQAPQRGHSRCAAGDMPGTDAACDEIFTTEYKQMASYNFEVAFLAGIAMYAKNASVEQKRLAAQKALGLIAARFNNFRNQSAFFHDVIYALNSKNQVQVWHPYASRWLTIPIDLKNEKVIKIEAGNDAFSLLLFTDRGQLYQWSPFEKIKIFSPALQNETGIQDGQRVVVPNLNEDIKFTFISDDQLKLVTFDEQGARVAIPYPFNNPQFVSKLKFKKIFYGLHNEMFLVTDQGQVIRKNRGKLGPEFVEIPELDKSGPWVSGNGGLLYRQMYLVNKRGELFELIMKNKLGALIDEMIPEGYELKKQILPYKGKVLKYAQGSFGDYYLDQQGFVFFKSLHSNAAKTFDDGRIKDFAIVKNAVPLGLFADLLRVPLETKCSMKQMMWDPVLYTAVGQDQNGKLIFSGLSGECFSFNNEVQVWNQMDFSASSKYDDKILSDIHGDGANFRSSVNLNLKNSDNPSVYQLSPEK